jgi:hypothetical protein
VSLPGTRSKWKTVSLPNIGGLGKGKLRSVLTEEAMGNCALHTEEAMGKLCPLLTEKAIGKLCPLLTAEAMEKLCHLITEESMGDFAPPNSGGHGNCVCAFRGGHGKSVSPPNRGGHWKTLSLLTD